MRVAALGTAIVMSAGLLSACSASAGNVTCDLKPNYAHESSGSPGFIDGKATLLCTGDKNPESADITVKLQVHTNGTWRDVSGSEATRHIAPVVAGKKYTTMSGTGVRCVNGEYRTAVRGQGTLAGVGSRSFDWDYSGGNTIRCR